ncbi:hypothetical protein BD413DRAFT_557100 [Trametes elegans]|nr:hypothetical protein BD413DRAFT_557100 [Trametes elegans]
MHVGFEIARRTCWEWTWICLALCRSAVTAYSALLAIWRVTVRGGKRVSASSRDRT